MIEVVDDFEDHHAGLAALAEIHNELHSRWMPHVGQIPVGRALFYEGCKNIFIQAGRNWGKTEFSAYACSRWGMENEGSENYIFEPYQNQAREILWESGRLQSFIPEQWIDSINNTEMRIRLTSGSFIKLDGADNDNSRRGIKPSGLIIYDEFKDMKHEFIRAMEPNRAAKNAPALFIGTPPEFENHYVKMSEFAKSNSNWKWFHAPTSQNPHITKEWLDQEKARLMAMGEEETWLREYEAIFVKGGVRHIVPQALKYVPKPLESLWPKSLKHWELNVLFDPAAASVFAVLFVLYNQYSRKSIAIDELYETSQEQMTVRNIWHKVNEKISRYKALGVREVRFIYDEAETWFMNETNEIPGCEGYWLEPTQKATNDKETGITLLRDSFNKGLIDITDNCIKFYWELENYMKDKNGRIPKAHDHCIDLIRYHLHAIGYSLEASQVPMEADKLLEKRFIRMEDELTFNPYEDALEHDLGSENYEEL